MMNFVPISLIVTLEIIKFWQATFFSWDVTMYDQQKDMPCQVQSSNLNEELGMVQYIFSDKTGTLTQNIMSFKKFTAGAYSYGSNNESRVDYKQMGITNVNFEDDLAFKHLEEPQSPNFRYLDRFMRNLAICHTVIIQKNKKGELQYNAASPDELALVNGAKFFGYTFEKRDEDNFIYLKLKDGSIEKYELLCVLEFNSDRKRMTVVVREPNGTIKAMTKGADNVIEERLKEKKQMEESRTGDHLEGFSNEGLRTLVIAEKTISEDFFQQWKKRYDEALMLMLGKDEAVGVLSEELENDFDLVGSTAIEDKLQDDLTETISFIKKAGIKLWVLTGDKIETAINIGYSCELLVQDMEVFIVDQARSNDIRNQITQSRRDQKLTELSRRSAVVVSGDALLKILSNELILEEFYELADNASVLIACRVSPMQKAQIVAMVRQKNKKCISLAIGDGANDVNMITSAHIGIGISGLEGQAAARASDYAIGQFKFLKTLLFYHGRECYRRNSYTVGYMFYKNVLLVFPIFFYGIMSLYSGQAIYEAYLYQSYNLVYTSWPILYFGLFDYEYSRKDFLKKPILYKVGIQNKFFSRFVFWRWVVYGIWQGYLLMYICFTSLNRNSDTKGMFGSFDLEGTFAFLMVVLVVNVKILMSTHLYTFWSFFFSIGSTLLAFLAWFLLNLYLPDQVFGTFVHLWQFSSFYFGLFFIASGIIMVDIGLNWAQRAINKIIQDQEVKQERQRQTMRKKAGSVFYHRRITRKQTRGFGFSQDEGQAPQVTERLTKNIKSMSKVLNPMNWGEIIKPTKLPKIQEDDDEENPRDSEHFYERNLNMGVSYSSPERRQGEQGEGRTFSIQKK